MKRLIGVAAFLAALGAPPVAAAQEQPIDITEGSGPPPLPATRPTLSVRPLTLEQALQNDAAYRAARARRRNGILLTAIGTPLGLAVGAVGVYFWDECSSEHAPESCSDTKYKVAAVLGYSVAGLSLAVGVSLIVSGQLRMSRIRRERERQLLPAVSLAPLPGGAQLGATWRF